MKNKDSKETVNDQASAKQQIVEKIKNSSNILVTVSADPTVDELSAALGLTMMLDKLKKHATAVVSGAIPPAIDFLDPGKTFENTVDSLRDFIIALDKEKADHLRYKVDGDVVKIFITPYRTQISSDDLDFSQGDYNVELVLALGVKNRDHLDKALVAHGRILHDATVVTISTEESSELGSIDWKDGGASSFSEMLVALSESLKADKPLLDEQIATALLTGIVAATDRFSNDRTSSKVMTMAAQLMAAGANQQLIASKLEEADEISHAAPDKPEQDEYSEELQDIQMVETKPQPEPQGDSGQLDINHQQPSVLDKAPDSPSSPVESEFASQLDNLPSMAPVAPTLSVADLQADLKSASEELDTAADIASQPPAAPSEQVPGDNSSITDKWQAPTYEETPMPTFGGTLNATTESAAEAKRQEEASSRNKTILTHGGGSYIGNNAEPFSQSPINSATSTDNKEPAVDPFAQAAQAVGLAGGDASPTAYAAPLEPLSAPMPQPSEGQTLADLDKQHRAAEAPHDEARAAVEAAFGAVPFNPAGQPEASVGAQPFGEVPHDQNSDGPADLPPLPPMPDFSTLPPPPMTQAPNPVYDPNTTPETLGDIFGPPPLSGGDMPPQAPNDPGQFKIPGQ